MSRYSGIYIESSPLNSIFDKIELFSFGSKSKNDSSIKLDFLINYHQLLYLTAYNREFHDVWTFMEISMLFIENAIISDYFRACVKFYV